MKTGDALELIELLDFDPELECEWAGGCSTPAAWVVRWSCSHVRVFCSPHKDAMVKLAAARLVRCDMHKVKTGLNMPLSVDLIGG